VYGWGPPINVGLENDPSLGEECPEDLECQKKKCGEKKDRGWLKIGIRRPPLV